MRAKHKTNVNKLRQMTEAEIDAGIAEDPDTFVPDASFWATATVVVPPAKQQITLKLDPDVIAWFKNGGRGYNKRINAVLKTYIQSQVG